MTENQIRPFFEAGRPVIVKFNDTSKNDFYGFFTRDEVAPTLKNKWKMVSNNNFIQWRNTHDNDLTVTFDGSIILDIAFSPY